MGNFKLSERSLKNLEGVHPNLVLVVNHALALSATDFTVVEGLRTIARQKQLVAEGASRTMASKHIDGLAVDLYPYYNGKVQVGAPVAKWKEISTAMKAAAAELGFKITWGGDWKTFIDMPHYQLEV